MNFFHAKKVWRSSARWLAHFICAAFLLGAGTAPAADSVSKEYKIKAAFLYNFSQYVEWPAEAFAAPDAPIVIGIFGANPFGHELENIVNGHPLNGRNFEIKRIKSLEEAKQTHILFFRANDTSEEILNGLKNSSVLTVGESARFLKLGGVIEFFPAGDNIHFDINNAAAERGKLKLSSQLKKLAQPAKP